MKRITNIERMLDKLNPTREEVIADYLAKQESIKDLPRVNVAHLKEIQDFIDAHVEIKSQAEASEVLIYFESLEEEWKEYYKILPSDVFPRIYCSIAYAYSINDDYEGALKAIQKCLNVVNHSNEYRWLFSIKADLYFRLALCYYKMNDVEQTRANINEAVCCQLTGYNNTSYNNFSFYTFRPVNEYVLEGIRDNKISLSNPYTFNDPVDPALFTHFKMAIENEANEEEKLYLKIQLEAYERVRITCLSRAQSFSTAEDNPNAIIKDPPFKEINKSTMWGYYANSHKGICIKYVFPSSFTDHEHQKENEVLILRNVNYETQYNPNKKSFNYTEAFFTKSKEWSHEGEWRLVYFQKKGEVPDYPWVELPEGCIKEIYIGCSVMEEDKRKLMAILKNKPEIRLYQMHVSTNNLFELEPVEIRREDYI